MSAATATPPITVTLPTAELVERLTTVARIATANGSFGIPGIRWVISGDQLALESVGADISMRTVLAIQGQTDVTFTLPAKVSLDVAKSLRGATAEFTSDGHTVQIRSGTAKLSLLLLRNDAVPPMPQIEGGDTTGIPAGDLRAAIAKVEKSAASRDDARQILTGVLVDLNGDHLSMVATDAYRMAKKEHQLTAASTGALSAIIPARVLAEVARLCVGADSEEIDFRVDKLRLVAAGGPTTIVARLLDGQYPNYRVLLDEKFTLQAIVPIAELSAAVRSMYVAKDQMVKLSFTRGELTISARSVEIGHVSETIPVAWTHDDLEIGFDIDFLRAGIDLVDGDDVELNLIAPQRPMTITSPTDDSFIYLVMPRRVTA